MTQTIPTRESSAIAQPPAPERADPATAAPEEPVGKPAQPFPELGRTWVYTDEPIFKLSVAAYQELIRLGHLTSDDKVELIEGVLVHRMTKNPPHAVCKARLVGVLDRMLASGWFTRTEDPVTLVDSEPEPDVMIIQGTIDDYRERHPYANEVGLVVEVADSTLRRDRGSKRRVYARGGIGVYWVVNLASRQIEVCTDPVPAADPPAYAGLRTYADGEAIELRLDGKMIGIVAVSDVLP